MSSSEGESNSNAPHATSFVPPESQSNGDKTPTEKMKVIVQDDGSVVGEYAKVWNSRSGDYVREHIPISYTNWRRVPQNLKDNVWNALMDEFELDVPPKVARPLLEKSWSQKFRTYKTTLRPLLKTRNPLGAKPKGVDRDTWRKFVESESDPKKQQQNIKNAENRQKMQFTHCLGRRSYAQKQYMMKKEQPEKPIKRVDKWLAAHEHADGTVLESAKVKYDEVKAAIKRRKDASAAGEGCSSNALEDLDNDELAEVFGKDKKGGVRGVGSNVSKKQLIHMGVAMAKIEQHRKENEEVVSLKDELISHVNSRLDNFQGMIRSVLSKLSNVNESAAPLAVSTPAAVSDLCSNTVGLSGPNSPERPDLIPVILLDKFGKELANGYVVTDATSGVCHLKKVGLGEKKVYVEKVLEPNAPVWDPPQWGHDTLAGFARGGYLIWLDCWLKYV
ncbi:hypothetical protein LguiB_006334 [Lonicera macranthoides]